MSVVLITGGGGFIGSHLAARLLRDGHEVHIAENFQRGARDAYLEQLLASPRAKLIEVDLFAHDAAERIGDGYEHIFHLAAIVGVANVISGPYRVLCQNVAMLNVAIEIAERQKALKRLAFASTSEVYAGTLAHGELAFPSPEHSKLVLPDLGSPRTSYMLSKLYGEALCRASGLPVTLFRPHNIYGPRMGLSHVIPELLQRTYQASDGGTLTVHSVDHRRTFCYIDDAVEFIRRIVEAPAGEGEVFNIGTETPEVAIGELAQLVIDTVGRSLEVVPGEVTPGSPTRRVPDTSHVRSVTGYAPQVGLAEGVRRTFDWYRDQVFEAAGPVVR